MAKVLYRVYRPSTFQQISGQEHVVLTIQNQYASGSLAHAYLFTGPRGVGKTTMARLIAKLVNCQTPKGNEPCNTCSACLSITAGQTLDIYEIDAASHTDVDNIRENIIQSVRFAPNHLKKKVYIIDEAHMLSSSAFNALLKTLEEPPEHVLFVLATTEIHKVPETIISRCQRFDFKRISSQELVKRMQGIVNEEGVKVDVEVLEEIARHSGGCARDAESLLGQVLALGDKQITLDQAQLVLPATQRVLIEAFANTLQSKQAAQAILLLNTYLEQGVDLDYFISDVIGWFRDRLLETVSATPMSDQVVFLQHTLEQLLKAQKESGREQIPQLPIELAILRICGMDSIVPTVINKSDFHQQGVDSSPMTSKPQYKPVSSEVLLEQPFSSQKNLEEAVVSEVVKTVFDTVPVLSLDQVKQKWPEVYEQIKACNASLPLMMQSCEISRLDGEHMDLGFEYDLYVQTVNQEKNRLVIEGVLEQVLGKRFRIRAIQSKNKPEHDETIQSLVQEFGGSLI